MIYGQLVTSFAYFGVSNFGYRCFFQESVVLHLVFCKILFHVDTNFLWVKCLDFPSLCTLQNSNVIGHGHFGALIPVAHLNRS